MKYDGLMDPECLEICDALNEFPGIETTESCCGHGERPFRVFFAADRVEALRPILIEIDPRPGWLVEVGWASGSDSLYFMLQGPAGAFDMADELAFFLKRRARVTGV